MALPVALLFILLLLLLVGLTFWVQVSATRASLPPGPPCLPILGNLLQLRGVPFLQALLRMRAQCGPVFTVRLGLTPVVVLWGYDAIHKALVEHAEVFSGRAQLAISERTNRGYGIAFSQGERWRTLRRFALTALRDLGLGRRSLEERIQEEVHCLEEELEKVCGTPFDPTFPIRRSIANIMCSVVFGRRFEYHDRDFKSFLGLLVENLKQVDTFWVQMYGLFPALLRHLPGPHNRLFEIFEKQKAFVGQVVKEHELSLDPAQPRDFIDSFLVRMQQEQGFPDTEFNQENLLNSALDIFFAGTETTSTTLRYGLLILLKFPQVTELVQKELDQVVGTERRPCLADRARMPYTDAVLHEIQRFADIMPLGVPRAVTQDTHFQGYHIPKGTMVLPLLHSVLHDPGQFQDPASFQPERFLDTNGAFKRSPAFLPFSAGRRACPGESLARAELFLYTTWLLQRFSPISPVPPSALDLQPRDSGFGKLPPAFQLILRPRQQHLETQARLPS